MIEYRAKKVRMNKKELEDNDVFYSLKNRDVKSVKSILRWANDNSLRTEITMLDIHKSLARTKSDKDFNTILDLVNKKSIGYFRIILRKQMNLFGILTNKKVINDLLEIAIRGIDVDSKEYFIMIYMDKKHLDFLDKKYKLIKQ